MIDRFEGRYRFLSNFYPAIVEYNLLMWNSTEHGYQAAKDIRGLDSPIVQKILTLDGREAGKSKKLGKQIEKEGFLRPDWKKGFSLEVMEELLQQKFDPFVHPDLRRMLDETKGQELVEGNTWHDNFWGDCECHECETIPGQNWLGKLLMKVRDGVLP